MNTSMMMALGMFVFQLPTLAYQEFQRQTAWRHPTQSRVGAAPSTQFLGKGDDTITLTGVLVPELAGSTLSLGMLRLMADQGMAWPLIEGTGMLYGLFVIESINETRSVFFRDGAARRIEFTINLRRVDDSQIELLGNLLNAGLDFLK
jgi:hypothetical protein